MKAFAFCVLTCCAAAHAATLGTYSGTVPVTDDRSLTQRQLNRIRWNGDRVALDANGYLKTYIPGMTVIIR